MTRIVVMDSNDRVIESWIDGEESGDNDGFDAAWCIEHETLGTDLPIAICHALQEALENEPRERVAKR